VKPRLIATTAALIAVFVAAAAAAAMAASWAASAALAFGGGVIAARAGREYLIAASALRRATLGTGRDVAAEQGFSARHAGRPPQHPHAATGDDRDIASRRRP
jgi:hypothetical protein